MSDEPAAWLNDDDLELTAWLRGMRLYGTCRCNVAAGDHAHDADSLRRAFSIERFGKASK